MTNFEEQWAGVPIFGFHHSLANPVGCVVLVHGFGEHCGRYLDSVVPQLSSANWAVLGFDLVGHGRSAGKRGVCRGYQQLLEQVQAAVRMARRLHPGLPLVLYGHSLGGNLALNSALRGLVEPDGIIASSAYLQLAFRPPVWKRWIGKLLYYISPDLTLSAGLEPDGISSQPEQVTAYLQDPLVHDQISPRFFFPVVESGEWALMHAAELACPVLIAHGSDDPIISPAGSRLLNQRVPQGTYLELIGNHHELHHDRGREQLGKTVSAWLEQIL